MENKDINRQAADFLGSPEGRKLSEHKDELEQLVQGEDGRRVRELINAESVRKAAQTGDVEALKGAVSSLLATPEGARLAGRLRDIMER
ncbi:MAG: hypothetical protein LBS90_08395 [Oscillospiraceae bacterium]|nr:hypothetical protein [Oscillospiraceae bacterium]